MHVSQRGARSLVVTIALADMLLASTALVARETVALSANAVANACI